MDYFEFKRWFEKQRAALKIPKDCAEPEPPTISVSTSYCWTFEWYLTFSDGKYIRIWEHYNKRKGLYTGRRLQFAFHYGPRVTSDTEGIPPHQHDDPVDIRIDNSQSAAHLHYGAPVPHYFQEKVEGIILEESDMFVFVKAMFKHRKSGKLIGKILGFRIR